MYLGEGMRGGKKDVVEAVGPLYGTLTARFQKG